MGRSNWGLDQLGHSLGMEQVPFENTTIEEPVGFSWPNVRLDHWIVLDLIGRDKNRHHLYRCVSLCGVMGTMRRSDLVTGATKTCQACRPNSAAPSFVIDPATQTKLAQLAKEIAVDERSNLRGEAIQDWENFGRPALEAVIDRSGLGRGYGWKLIVRDCHRTSQRPEAAVRITAFRDNERRVSLMVRPTGGRYSFECDLATGRTNVSFADVRQRLIDALMPVITPAPAAIPTPIPEEKPVPIAPISAAVPVAPTILGGLDLGKLLRMRDGLDSLMTVGKDVQTATDLKTEALAALATAEAEASPLRGRHTAAVEVARTSVFEAEEAQNKADTLQRQLADAVAKRDQAAAAREAAHAALDAAQVAYEPARLAVEERKRQLAEAEHLEADRLKALGRADDLLPLLAALQKLQS